MGFAHLRRSLTVEECGAGSGESEAVMIFTGGR